MSRGESSLGRSWAVIVGRRLAPLFVVLLLLPLLTACPRNPSTGERQLILVSEAQEISMGRQVNDEVARTMGIYGEGGLEEYLEGIGGPMAEGTERPGLPWSFRVADVPEVNAFAAPGGFLFMTRGILAHFDSEAEMAAVLGHEIAHVTARHSAERMSRAQLAQLGLGLGSVLSDDVARFSEVLGLGLGILFLKYSRDDERQADRLGLQYLIAEGYEPTEAVDVFRMLERQSEGTGGGPPTWLSTHPSPEDRIENIRAILDTLPAAGEASRVGRDRYLSRIEGLPYGPDPRNGYFRGDTLLHPRAGIRLVFPRGWERNRLPLALSAASPEETAGLRASLADTLSWRAAADRFFSRNDVERIRARETSLGGLQAVVGQFRASSSGQPLRGFVAFVERGDGSIGLLALAVEQAFRENEAVLRGFVESVARLTDREARAATPLRLDLVTPRASTTIEELLARRGSPVGAEDLALLNGVEVDESLPAGRPIKWVVGSLPPAMR